MPKAGGSGGVAVGKTFYAADRDVSFERALFFVSKFAGGNFNRAMKRGQFVRTIPYAGPNNARRLCVGKEPHSGGPKVQRTSARAGGSQTTDQVFK